MRDKLYSNGSMCGCGTCAEAASAASKEVDRLMQSDHCVLWVMQVAASMVQIARHHMAAQAMGGNPSGIDVIKADVVAMQGEREIRDVTDMFVAKNGLQVLMDEATNEEEIRNIRMAVNAINVKISKYECEGVAGNG